MIEMGRGRSFEIITKPISYSKDRPTYYKDQNSQDRTFLILDCLMLVSLKSKMNDFADNSLLKQNSRDRNDVMIKTIDCSNA
jgi:hypothetical protein